MRLTTNQRKAVESTAPKILCVAGPGSGKTATLVARIQRLIDGGVDPKRILAMTFTNSAADEMRKRLGVDLGHLGTLHGFCMRLLTRHYLEAGLSRPPVVIDEEMAETMMDQTIEELKYNGSKADVSDALGRTDRKPVMTKAEIVAVTFRRKLSLSGTMTFDMLVQRATKLLMENRELFRYRWEHLLVDEYQDTCDLDAAIYRAMPVPNLFVVGDPDQSIYGFRGGKVDHILTMATEEDVEVICLEDNFRSGRVICETAQQLIEHNMARVPKETRPAKDEAGFVGVSCLDNANAELAMLANQIAGLDPAETAVLVRSNHLVGQIAGYLRGLGVPIKTREVPNRPKDWKLAKAILAVTADLKNDLAAYWVMRLKQGRKDADRAQLLARAHGEPLANQLGIGQTDRAVEALDMVQRQGVSEEALGWMGFVLNRLTTDATPQDLLTILGEMENALIEQGAGVTVCTMHSSKGREWDNVFLPAFEETVIPSSGRAERIEEERRLAYVAITRARKWCQISFVKERVPQFSYRPVPAVPSRFLVETELWLEGIPV